MNNIRRVLGCLLSMVAAIVIGTQNCKAALLTLTPNPAITSVVEGITSGLGFIQFTVTNNSLFAVLILADTARGIRDVGPDFGDKVSSTNLFGDTCPVPFVVALAPGASCTFNLGFDTPGADVGELVDFGASFIFADTTYRNPSTGRLEVATGFGKVNVYDDGFIFIPEPGSVLLLGAGLLLFWNIVRRRRAGGIR